MKKLLFGLLITGLLVGTVAADGNDSCVQPIRPSCSVYEDLSCQSEWADYYMKLDCYLYSRNGSQVKRGVLLER